MGWWYTVAIGRDAGYRETEVVSHEQVSGRDDSGREEFLKGTSDAW